MGRNDDYFQRLRPKKGNKIKEMVVHSEIDMKDNKRKHIYKLWFDFIFEDDQSITTEIFEINCTKVIDERGYIHGDEVVKILANIIKNVVPNV